MPPSPQYWCYCSRCRGQKRRTARTIRSHIEGDRKDSLNEANPEWIRNMQQTTVEKNKTNLSLQMDGVNHRHLDDDGEADITTPIPADPELQEAIDVPDDDEAPEVLLNDESDSKSDDLMADSDSEPSEHDSVDSDDDTDMIADSALPSPGRSVPDGSIIHDGVDNHSHSESVQPVLSAEHIGEPDEPSDSSHAFAHWNENPEDELPTEEEPQVVDNEIDLDAMRAKMLKGYTLDPLGRPERHFNGPRKLSKSEEMSLRHYLAWQKSGGTVAAYDAHAENLSFYSNEDILSLHKVRALAEELTGIKPIMVDMCPNGCLAFVGKHANDEYCQGILKETVYSSQRSWKASLS
ncbi:hypothetical protein EYR38_002155 [Pleurotus pulmonarius]|nr:hypothetical protein EYR38_002155 [Pleurotus pulmonarius]